MKTVRNLVWAVLIFGAFFASCELFMTDEDWTSPSRSPEPWEQWEPWDPGVYYTVRYSINGGYGDVPPDDTASSNYGTYLPYCWGNFSKDGYDFGGWSTNAAGTGTNYAPGSLFTPTGDITLYARWVINYTITFELNGGGGWFDPITDEAGSSVILPDGSFLTRDGFFFDGWNTEADGTGITYQSGDSYTLTGNITLYAMWKAEPGAETNPIPLTANIWTDGEMSYNYNGNESVVWYSFNVTGGATYYVWWNGYYQGNSTKTLEGYVSAYYGDGTSVFTETEAGWEIPQSFTANTGGTVLVKVATSRYYSQTFSVVYNTSGIRPTYTVTYDYNIKDLPHTEQKVVQAGSSVTMSGWTRSGYTFAGWNTNASGTGTNYGVWEPYTPTGNITLYAKWILDSEPITLTENIWTDGEVLYYEGGVWYLFNVTSGKTYSVWWNDRNQGNNTKTLYASVRAMYRSDESEIFYFNGSGYTNPQSFTADRNGTVLIRVTSSNYSIGTFGIVYSTGSSRPLLVTFNANGGSGEVPKSIGVAAGSSITLPGGNSLTRSGYTFSGWNTNSSGTGNNYLAGSTLTATSDTTLYARWLRNHTVTFDANGGSNAPNSVIVINGSSTTLPAGNGLTRSGYTFVGWNTNASGTGTNYQPGDSVTPSADATFYAKWIINRTVTFDANGGTGAVPSQTVMDGDSITIPSGSGLSRSEYTFVCWNANSAGTGTNYSPGAPYTLTANVTLYAVWLPMAGITLSVEQIVDGLPIIADITISRTGNGYTATRSVSVNAADYDAGSISWKIAGVGVYAGQTITGSGASFILNAGDVKYNSLGIHVLTLTVTKNGQPYQRAIPFTIVP